MLGLALLVAETMASHVSSAVALAVQQHATMMALDRLGEGLHLLVVGRVGVVDLLDVALEISFTIPDDGGALSIRVTNMRSLAGKVTLERTSGCNNSVSSTEGRLLVDDDLLYTQVRKGGNGPQRASITTYCRHAVLAVLNLGLRGCLGIG